MEKSSEAGRRGLNLQVVGDISVRGTTGDEGDERSCGDQLEGVRASDVSFSCVVKTQRRWSNKIYKSELTKTRYNNQVLGKYRVDPQRAGLTLIAELTWSNLGLKGVLNKRK